MNHTAVDLLIVFFAPIIGAYFEKHYGWWSWIENNILFEVLPHK